LGPRISQVTDPIGRTVQYGYDSFNRLISVTDPSGGVTTYGYDNGNRMTTLTDARGITFLQNTYDAGNRVVQQVDADGGVYRFQYYGPNGKALFTAPRVSATGSGCGSTTIVINAGSPPPPGTPCVVVVIVPSPAQFLVAQSLEIDPEGNVTSYRFNGEGYLVEETRHDGSVVQYERANGTNQLLSTTDPLGRKTGFTYDSANNVTSITDPAGNVTHFTYESNFNRVTSITDAAGDVSGFTYDDQGNLISSTDPLGKTTTLGYNSYGQPLTVTDPLGNATAFEYDQFGNLTATVDPLGNRTTRVYDLVSRLTGLTDPLGRTTSYEYDALNRVTQITDALGGETGFTYDPNGNLLTVADANGHVTTHTYDVMDRLETRTDPLGSAESYVYDFNGNLTQFTDRKGQVSQFYYDALNRRIESDYADGSATTFTYDSISRLLQVYDSTSGLIQMGYDDLDRLTQELTPQGVVSYNYDAIGRRTSMTANGLAPVNYQYDNASRLTQVAQGSNAVNLGYDGAGRRTSLTYPNGTAANYFYDNASRLTELLHQGPSGVIEDLLYTYDAAGNRISFGRNDSQAELPPAVTAAYNAANQMTHFNTDMLTYDANGNLTFDGTTTYTWDARNRLTQMSNANVSASFVYDALGRRVSKTINGATTQYLYDGNDIMAEIQYGAISAMYLRSLNIDEPFLRSSSIAEYYHTDALGSTLVLTDQSGGVQTTYSYDPFGNTTVAGTSSNPFQYTGRENDGTGAYYYRARYYSPILQRFINEDPILAPLTPLSLGLCRVSNLTVWLLPPRIGFPDPELSQFLNPFAYVEDNPLKMTDASGMISQSNPCYKYFQPCVDALNNIPSNKDGSVGLCVDKKLQGSKYGCGRKMNKICAAADFSSTVTECMDRANIKYKVTPCLPENSTIKCINKF
jgi:RHS repeat-associated protein